MIGDFVKSFENTLRIEGGYRLTNDPTDRGGMTFAGISRKFNPHWEGWALIDAGKQDDPRMAGMVRAFYKENYWDKMHGDDLVFPEVANTLYDCSVNMGVRNATKLAQVVLGTTPDGAIGPVTLASLNDLGDSKDAEIFTYKYAFAKLARYSEICARDRSQIKYLRGWMLRTISGIG